MQAAFVNIGAERTAFLYGGDVIDPEALTEQRLNGGAGLEDLSPEEKEVVKLLREPIPRDDLIRAMKMPTSTANSILSVMEIKELIKEEMGEIKLT